MLHGYNPTAFYHLSFFPITGFRNLACNFRTVGMPCPAMGSKRIASRSGVVFHECTFGR